jgi:glyoxylate/hydroxypyruvate reductase A
MIDVLIASPLEPHLVERIASVDPRFNVTYRSDLLGVPRYHGDHFPPVERTPEQAAEWAALLAGAEVLFDVDQPSASDLASRAPRLKWLQTSSSGVGELVRRLDIVDRPIVVSNAAGIHAVPLAEFVLFAMLYFARDWPRRAAEQRAHHWERCTIETLEGKTLGIVGFGSIGQAIARLARPLGLRVIGLRRSAAAFLDADSDADADGAQVYGPEHLQTLLRTSDYVVLSVPHTDETVGLLGSAELHCMKPTAVLINIARGSVVDEPALIDALQTGRLAGAALDVTATEPLPPDSPLWDLPNVIITPHSMSTASDENERLTDLFCENLRRYADGEPLRNRIDKQRGY